MKFYRHMDKTLLTDEDCSFGEKISEIEASKDKDLIYYLTRMEPGSFSNSWCLSHSSLFHAFKEDASFLTSFPDDQKAILPSWLSSKIERRQLKWINTEYPNWQQDLLGEKKDKWRINIVGLGDVGGILLTGLRLLGGDIVERIGIYDIDNKKVERWLMEASQILSPDHETKYPEIVPLKKEELFCCDMFIFALSVGVPSMDSSLTDVRMAQYEGNSKIIRGYAINARENGFKGIFAVLSDPVDLLCRKAFIESNRNHEGIMDYKGLAPDRIRGYGLGVMRARAAFHSKKMGLENSFERFGRAYGPHGKGLVIADSIESYNDSISLVLTEKTLASNLEVRKTGFKPYIAPALSSGALSILAAIRGQWHYSSVFIGGIYFGCRNRLTISGTELERLNIPEALMLRIKESYKNLGDMQ